MLGLPFGLVYLLILGNDCPPGFYKANEKCISVKLSNGKCPPYSVYSTVLQKCIHYHYHYHDKCPSEYQLIDHRCAVNKLSDGSCPEYTIYSDEISKCVLINYHDHSKNKHNNSETKIMNEKIKDKNNDPKLDEPKTIVCPEGYVKINNGCVINQKTDGLCPPFTVYSNVLGKCIHIHDHDRSENIIINNNKEIGDKIFEQETTDQCPDGFEKQNDICVRKRSTTDQLCPPFTVYSNILGKCVHIHDHDHSENINFNNNKEIGDQIFERETFDQCPDGFEKQNDICVRKRSTTDQLCPPFTVYSNILGKCIHIHDHDYSENNKEIGDQIFEREASDRCPDGFEKQNDICVRKRSITDQPCPPFLVYSEILGKCIHDREFIHDTYRDYYRNLYNDREDHENERYNTNDFHENIHRKLNYDINRDVTNDNFRSHELRRSHDSNVDEDVKLVELKDRDEDHHDHFEKNPESLFYK